MSDSSGSHGAWSVFQRSIFSPRSASTWTDQVSGPAYFWRLCGLYLCLPVAAVFAVAFLWELGSPETAPMDAGAAPIIGLQVILLLPLLYVSNLLIAKITVRISSPDQKDSANDLVWLLASNCFFLLGAFLGVGVILANLDGLKSSDSLETIGAPVMLLLFAGSVVMWLRSATTLIQIHRPSTLLVAVATAVAAAAAILVAAWLTIGIVLLIVLLPIGLIAG